LSAWYEPALLAAADLACVRGGRRVFAEVAFTLEPGDALILRGRNGAGKSSLLRLLAGLLEPAAGSLAWHGRPIGEDPAAHRSRCHLVGHGNALKSALTVAENLRFAAAVCGAPAAPIGRALAGFELTELAGVPAAYLSAGQKRRLALARLLAAPRPLWLLDEPEAGLDAANRERLAGAIAAHLAEGGIGVIATHGDIGIAASQVLELAA
jgi:heme exporter protein A